MPLTDLGTWHRCRSLIARHVPGCCLLTVTAVPIACMRDRPVLRQCACPASFFGAWTQFQSCRNIPLVHTVVVSRVPAATQLWACTPAPRLRSFAHALWRQKMRQRENGRGVCVVGGEGPWNSYSLVLNVYVRSYSVCGTVSMRVTCLHGASPACTVRTRGGLGGGALVGTLSFSG